MAHPPDQTRVRVVLSLNSAFWQEKGRVGEGSESEAPCQSVFRLLQLPGSRSFQLCFLLPLDFQPQFLCMKNGSPACGLTGNLQGFHEIMRGRLWEPEYAVQTSIIT